MVTRRHWFLQLGGGVVLAGLTARDLEAAELPPGVYEPSREHLGHALAGQPVALGGETELLQPHPATFQPAFFSPEDFQTIACLTALILGEAAETPAVHEIAEWMDLTLSEAAAVRSAARSLSAAHRSVAVHFYGSEQVQKLEQFDAQKICREGLAWLDAEAHGRFTGLPEPEQIALLRSISDERPNRTETNAGNAFFAYLKGRVVDGFYTSRAGLEELGYRGNAFYVSPPGCEHLYG